MPKNLRLLLGSAAGMIAAVTFSSCAYDPYNTSVGGSYSSGYGDGYGYGGSSFSSSVFVSTGDPRWGYDPGCYSYYDYGSRRYYDPYLNGYYPVGYRPPVVYGVSHPYGWRPGSGYCRPPSRVTNVMIANYRNRESSYRNSGYSSGGQNHYPSRSQPRDYRQPSSRNGYDMDRYQGRAGSNYPNLINPYPRQNQGSSPRTQPYRQENRSDNYRERTKQPTSRYPSRYHNPVSSNEDPRGGSRSASWDQRGRQAAQQASRNQVRPLAPPDLSSGNPQRTRPQPTPGETRNHQTKGRGYRDRPFVSQSEDDGSDPRGRGRN